MPAKKMLLIIMLLIVVVLAGCASSPRRTVSPVVTTPAHGQPNVHITYPVSGQPWTHECSTCGEKIGRRPMAYQSPAPPQLATQKTSLSPNKLFGRGNITSTEGYDNYSTEVLAKDIPGGVHSIVIRRREYKWHTDHTRTHGAHPEGGY